MRLHLTIHTSRFDTATDKTLETSWDALCREFSNHARRSQKDGEGFSAARYDGPSRKIEHAVETCLLGLDLDKNWEARPLDIDTANEYLAKIRETGWEHLIYSTYSHRKPDAVSLRVLFPLSRPITREEFRPAWRNFIQALGVPSGIKTDNIARFWYAPACPEDAEPFVARIPGDPIPVDTIAATEETQEAPERKDYKTPSPSVISAAAQYLEAVGPAIQGQGGNPHTFRTIAHLKNDLALPDEIADPMLWAWNDTNQPPWSDTEFQKLLDVAADKAETPFGFAREAIDFASEITSPKGSEPTVEGTFSTPVYDLALQDIPPVEFLPTGFKGLDECLGGGLNKRGVALITAPPGSGKSGLVMQLVKNITTPESPGLYLSTELEAFEVLARFSAPALGLSWRDVLMGKGDKSIIQKEAKRYPLHIIGAERLTLDTDKVLEDVAVECKRLRVSILVVDYMQDLLRDPRADARAATSDLILKLRIMAQKLNICVLAVSSVSRAFYGDKADTLRKYDDATVYLGTAKESGNVEFSCSSIMFVDVDREASGENRVARIAIAKSRYGRSGFAGAVWHPKTGRWDDRPESVWELSAAGQAGKKQKSEEIKAEEDSVIALVKKRGKDQAVTLSALRKLVPGLGSNKTWEATKRALVNGRLKQCKVLGKDLIYLPEWV